MATAKQPVPHELRDCHGSDGGGAKGFPNLTDADWLWGGDARRRGRDDRERPRTA